MASCIDSLNEGLRILQQKQLEIKTDAELRSLLVELYHGQHSVIMPSNTGMVISAIEKELSFRDTRKLQNITAELTAQTTKLVGIAEAQRVLAAKLDGQTDTLIKLTGSLNRLTVWLVVLTVALCIFEVIHFVVR